jgi:hypothetical protein
VALDSIAKLSVLITGDETPLAASARRAEAVVGGMGRRMDAASASTMKLSQAMSAMRGNIPALFQVSGLSGASAGPVAALVAMTAATYKMASASDALDVSLQRSELDTWTGQWKRLKQEIATTNSLTAGGTFSMFFRDASGDMADYVRSWNEWLNPQKTAEIAARAKWLAETEQRERGAAEAAKLHAKAQAAKAQALKDAAQAAEAERSARGETLRRAEDIRAMVRTPAEEFQRSVNELRSFFMRGFIDQATMDRAMEMAQERFDSASKPKDRATHQAMQSIGAVERYSMAGYSAGLPTRQDDKREEKQLVNQGQQMIQVMQHIDAILATRTDAQTVRLSSLN